MYPNGCNNRCPRGGGFFSVIAIFALCVLIFYQIILTLILPLRFNIFIMFIEVLLLIFFLYRIVWPY